MNQRYSMSLLTSLPLLSISTEKIEEIGVEPYLEITYAKEWPTLIGQNWTGESQFDRNDVITRYFEVSVEPLDSHDLYFSRVYFMRNDSVLMAYKSYLRDTAIYLKAKPDVAAKDAADVLDLEIKLSKV
ncbi:membrane metallo-endopeptidase-like 1 [Plakobranchus ocellatus]|uniref:Membrane metallo-endopeptidase-like 1 n=1 Tax=Plakobranchus ocellatus TaxID=259542 RepID=A0AAV4AJR8_9GAST|nr:membrane metallo-endopeptidase-like 1 [Plakobranchus ocellatus]